jgi:hypothetical protein
VSSRGAPLSRPWRGAHLLCRRQKRDAKKRSRPVPPAKQRALTLLATTFDRNDRGENSCGRLSTWQGPSSSDPILDLSPRLRAFRPRIQIARVASAVPNVQGPSQKKILFACSPTQPRLLSASPYIPHYAHTLQEDGRSSVAEGRTGDLNVREACSRAVSARARRHHHMCPPARHPPQPLSKILPSAPLTGLQVKESTK